MRTLLFLLDKEFRQMLRNRQLLRTLLLAPLIQQPWHLYATLGVLVGGGANCLGYTGHSLFLPNWFVRRRGLALSVAFSGVGVGSILLLPWLQGLIGRAGWRTACGNSGREGGRRCTTRFTLPAVTSC